jgi:hypothetical protein
MALVGNFVHNFLCIDFYVLLLERMDYEYEHVRHLDAQGGFETIEIDRWTPLGHGRQLELQGLGLT